MPPFLPRPSNSLLLFLLTLFPTMLSSPSAAAPCNASQVRLVREAFRNVKGLNTSLLHSPASLNCSGGSDGAVELRLPSRNLSGLVGWMVLANVSGLRVVNLSGNALEGSLLPGFFSSASSLLHLDLASNKLGGTINLSASLPAVSPLLSLNLSDNRFANQPVLSRLGNLRELDLSRNNLSAMPEGIQGMKALERLDLSRCNISRVGPSRGHYLARLGTLKYLDLSGNGMEGSFPEDLPPLNQDLRFLNLSGNNFSGVANGEEEGRFGRSAFLSSGVRTEDAYGHASVSAGAARPTDYAGTPLQAHQGGVSPTKKSGSEVSGAGGGQQHGQDVVRNKQPVGKTEEEENNKQHRKALVLGLAIGGSAALLAGAGIASAACCLYRRRKRERKRKQWTIAIPGTWKATRRGHYHTSTPRSSDPEAAWVAEASVSAPSAPLVMFEKPLMELTFSDMMAATSGFGRESQLAEGRATGPVYRAVLPGDMDVAIKVLVHAREMDESQAKAAVQDLAGLKHPNLLPLLGYCIAGREKLLLYQYMENGDLHRWLHELPLAEPAPASGSSRSAVEDWAAGPAEGGGGTHGRGPGVTSAWASRYRIALGVARGLAFLHHAASGTPIVHGNVEASNVLLDESLDPRVAGLWPRTSTGSGGGHLASDDVYGYGVVLLELLTGRVGSREEVCRIRGQFKGGNGPAALDRRVLDGSSDWGEVEEKEMVEALRVAYLCTADPAEKRPSMRQVVGLLKDIRPLAV